MTMKRWVILLVCWVCWGMEYSSAEKLTFNNFSYTTYTNEAIITDYTGSDKILSIPTELNGTTITELESIGTTNNVTEIIYVPSSISVKKQALKNCRAIHTIILEQDNLKELDNTNGICYQDDGSIVVNNIIILGNCDHSADYYIGYATKSKFSNKLTIGYKRNGGSTINISMFIYGKTFSSSNLEALKKALELNTSDLTSITEIDLSGVTCSFTSGTNPSSLFPNASIITTGKTYENNHTIKDLEAFTAVGENVEFEQYQYTRTNTTNWNSVCLPFPISESMFPGDTKIYTLNDTQSSATAVSLKRIASAETELSAGVPCYIQSTASSWTLTIPKDNVTANAPAGPVTAGGWQIVGSFTEAAIVAGEYKLNTAGSAFGITTSNAKVYPYRCYLHKVGSSPSPARLSVSLEEPDGTTETVSLDEIMREQNEEPTTAPQLYDLFGRPRSQGSAGLFVRPTRH